jgi:signal recognition particle subunit SRP19
MPPRATIVEEFDDDTDLPLPSRALPNMGTRGALLEEITSDDEDDMEIPMQPTLQPKPVMSPFAGLAQPSQPRLPSSVLPPGMKVTTDKEAFKE